MKNNLLLLSIALLLVTGTAKAQTVYNFIYTGATQTWVVPTGVTSISVDVKGASGGTGYYSSSGGCGGEVVCTLAVTPGQTVYLNVGGIGGDGVFFGGGAGGFSADAGGFYTTSGGNGALSFSSFAGAGGGGGSSDIRIGGITSSSIMVLAGGGAGAGYDPFGCGSENGGDGGGPGTAGNGQYCGFYNPFSCGSGASALSPGIGSSGGGFSGSFLLGGDGVCPSYVIFTSFSSSIFTFTSYAATAGGGGGGGYYGGGGGTAGGGGGGSSYVDPSATSVVSTLGSSCSGDGSITITTTCVPPVAGTITGPTTVCVGSSITLTDPTGTGGGTWTSSNPLVATAGPSTGLITGVMSGTVTVSYSITLPCGTATATTVVTVNPLPNAGAITGTLTVCPTGTTALTDPTGMPGGTWTSVSPLIATINSSTGLVTGMAVGTSLISYTVTNSCGTASATATVTVSTTPNAGTITGVATLCQGGTTTLSDGVGGGVWSSVNPGVALIGSTGIVTGLAAGVSTISYTVTGACGVAAATLDVTVNPLPNAGFITGTLVVCPTATTLLADPAPGGVWSSILPTIATIGTSGLVTGVAAGTSTISYTVTTSCGTVAATAVVTVNPSPFAGTITGTDSLCPMTTTTLSDATGGGTWTSVTTGVATIGSTGIVSGITTGTSTISYAVTNSCGTAAATVIVTVDPLPNAGTISGSANVCKNGTTPMSETVGGGVWSVVTGLTSITATGVDSGISLGIDTIIYTYTNSCGIATTRKNITVITVPVVSGISGAPSDGLCTGTNATLTDATPGGVWSSGSATATVSSGGVVTGASAGPAIISYTVSNVCGATSTTTTVNIITAPPPLIISGPTTICPDSIAALSVNYPGGTWGVTNGTALIDVTGVMGGDHPGMDTITYIVTNKCGTQSATYPVTVLPYGVCDHEGVKIVTQNESALYIHPNPNAGTFTMLLSSGNNEQVEVSIVNILGEKVKSFVTTTNTKTDVRLDVSAGIYFVSALTSTGQYTAKIVIAK